MYLVDSSLSLSFSSNLVLVSFEVEVAVHDQILLKLVPPSLLSWMADSPKVRAAFLTMISGMGSILLQLQLPERISIFGMNYKYLHHFNEIYCFRNLSIFFSVKNGPITEGETT